MIFDEALVSIREEPNPKQKRAYVQEAHFHDMSLRWGKTLTELQFCRWPRNSVKF